MDHPDYLVFSTLYREAYVLCFKQPLKQPVSETESKLFYNQIWEHTGLSIGWRSLKNYSFYVLGNENEKQENPSIATLDALARYVLKAPYTNEVTRKNNEAHHPYWFLYRERYLEKVEVAPKAKNRFPVFAVLGIIILISGIALYWWYKSQAALSFTDDFKRTDEQSFQNKGWQVVNKNDEYWMKRNSLANSLTLFTLPGDNWPDTSSAPSIQNLLIRKLPQNCFKAELQMESFIPAGEWQQAGLLLLADSSLNSPSIRISLGYNDFFGGNQQPKEVIVQAISTPGNGEKPEEFIHFKVLAPDSAAEKPVLFGNLKHTALRIEKQGRHYRFLYAGGLTVNDAFKELAVKDLITEPRYVAIFALKGRVKDTPVVPVVIRKFILQQLPCD
ncbi:hypothetical protein SAMN05421821_119106 [Mucilaginibacter lappiensis]|nr:hypothetical protein SAMN05421821_119106 [Mucilaginibacter lappiensis]